MDRKELELYARIYMAASDAVNYGILPSVVSAVLDEVSCHLDDDDDERSSTSTTSNPEPLYAAFATKKKAKKAVAKKKAARKK